MAHGSRAIEADRIPASVIVMNRLIQCSGTQPRRVTLQSVSGSKSRINFVLLLFLSLTTLWSSSAWAQGWYLLQPPEVQKSSGPAEPDASKPLSEWRQFMAFGSVDECEDARVKGSEDPRREWAEAKRELERITKDASTSILEQLQASRRAHRARRELLSWAESRCISSNDPRLR